MQSIIGSNAALRYLKAYDAHISYWHEVNPAYQVAYIDDPLHIPSAHHELLTRNLESLCPVAIW